MKYVLLSNEALLTDLWTSKCPPNVAFLASFVEFAAICGSNGLGDIRPPLPSPTVESVLKYIKNNKYSKDVAEAFYSLTYRKGA